MIDVTLTFGTYDFSSLLSTYRVRHEIEVADSVRTIDGTEHVATFTRPVIEFSLVPLSGTTAAAVYTALSVIEGLVDYTDPNLGIVVQDAPFRLASNLDNLFRLKSIDGNLYYKGGTIVLRRKTVL